MIADGGYDGWWVPRRNLIFGREVRHGGWYPDYQLRLLRVGRAHYDPAREVHEVVLLDGPEGYLSCPLWHHNYRTLGQFAAKQRQYVDLEAGIRLKQGVRPKPWTYLAQPLREFWRRYVRLKGYRDGWLGLVLAALIAGRSLSSGRIGSGRSGGLAFALGFLGAAGLGLQRGGDDLVAFTVQHQADAERQRDLGDKVSLENLAVGRVADAAGLDADQGLVRIRLGSRQIGDDG